MRKQYENNIRKGGIAEEIAILKQRREARKAKENKKTQLPNQALKESDKKFLKMITQKKNQLYSTIKPQKHIDSVDSKIFVILRKRPIFQKELNHGEIDCISIINPRAYIHECKVQVDGITKYLEDHEFFFDNTFDENDKTEDIYKNTLYPMIDLILHQGIVTCFAYGQTGSGKTYTMKGLETLAIDDLYKENKKMGNIFEFYVNFFEIYGGRLYDLLNNKNKVEVLDDKNGKVQIYGLINQLADSPETMHHIINSANAIRTTHNTVTNETSSRSHAICNIIIKLKNDDDEYGKLSLVDLAGSERAQETQSNNKDRRAEGAEINKSLLALKECIRALEEKKNNSDIHVPFRAAKLTHVLRDSFVSREDNSRIIMISCVTPCYTCANHSLNTLRYSDRLKEKTKHHFGGNYNNVNIHARDIISNAVNNKNNNQSVNLSCNDNNNNINYSNSNNVKNKKQSPNVVKSNKNNIKLKKNTTNDFKESENPKKTKSFKYNDKINLMRNYIYEQETEKTYGLEDEQNDDNDYLDEEGIVNLESEIINMHMNTIKAAAGVLSEEGDLITNIKGVGKEEDFTLDEYIDGLEKILDKKINMYGDIKDKIEIYKRAIQKNEMNNNYDEY